jgi:23S rRNA (cytosine1962-C5)-methyltransferase
VLENGEVRIAKRGADRIRRGHLWVYRSDIKNADALEPGSVVRVRDERERIVGKAFYSSKSQIALRFLCRDDTKIDEEFFRRRLAAADTYRARAGIDPKLSRRIFSEGDLLPGLIVDRYGEYLVIQSLIQSTDRLEPLLKNLLVERYQPKSILVRNDNRVRELEGLELRQEIIGEPIPDPLTIFEDNKAISVSLTTGQKTGSYLDQRDNHRIAGRLAFGRALDAFCYAGGFALHMSAACDTVEAVDISTAAVDLARANAARNGLTNMECIEENVFDFLRRRFSEGVRYDTIVLDPPAFAKNKESLVGAIRGYKEVNNRAMRLLRSGGILITCSCSHHLSEAIFAEMLAEAANDAGCWLRVLDRRTQAPDHPILMSVPETLYLKCFVLQVLY